jgi:hypothetical protein
VYLHAHAPRHGDRGARKRREKSLLRPRWATRPGGWTYWRRGPRPAGSARRFPGPARGCPVPLRGSSGCSGPTRGRTSRPLPLPAWPACPGQRRVRRCGNWLTPAWSPSTCPAASWQSPLALSQRVLRRTDEPAGCAGVAVRGGRGGFVRAGRGRRLPGSARVAAAAPVAAPRLGRAQHLHAAGHRPVRHGRAALGRRAADGPRAGARRAAAPR